MTEAGAQKGSITGGCLCGAVRYESAQAPKFATNCYCRDCQKESGAGHLPLVAVPDAGFSATGPMSLFVKPADSGNDLPRTFCSKCGTTVFARPVSAAGLTLIRAGTLDDPSLAAPRVNIYVSRAHAWDPPSDALPGHAEMPAARK